MMQKLSRNFFFLTCKFQRLLAVGRFCALRSIGLVVLWMFVLSLPAAQKNFVLVIDAGHGGKDAGAVGLITNEKSINLRVALAFGRLVEQNCPDVKVLYTRKTDVFVTLQGRAEIANKAKADLFVSIHTNAVATNKLAVRGAETYSLGMHRAKENLEVAKRENSVITLETGYKDTYQGFDPRKAESYIIFEFMQDRNMQQSVNMARAIQQQYGSAGRKDKGVHQAGFLVLRATSMPSVLTELGFISHPDEEKFMASDEGVSVLSRAIYEGFLRYKRQSTAYAAPLPDNAAPVLAQTERNDSETPSGMAVGDSVLARSSEAKRDDDASARVKQMSNSDKAVAPSLEQLELVPVKTKPFAQTVPAELLAERPELHAEDYVLTAPSVPTSDDASATQQAQVAQMQRLRQRLAMNAKDKQSVSPTPQGGQQKGVLQQEELKGAKNRETVGGKAASVSVTEKTEKIKKEQAIDASIKNVKVADTEKAKNVKQTAKIEKSAAVAEIDMSKTKKTVGKIEKTTAKQEKASTKENNISTQKDGAELERNKSKVQRKVVGIEDAKKQQQSEMPKKDNEKSILDKTQQTKVAEKSASVVYKIQILSRTKPLASDDELLKGLNNVEVYRDGGAHKYTCGSATSLTAIKKQLSEVKARFPEAFIVAFSDGRRIDLSTARQLSEAKKK